MIKRRASMNWQVIDTGIQNAEENMRFDIDLLEKAETFASPVLHLYEWKGDSATYGYFMDPAKWLNMNQVKLKSLSLAKRPTGGGIIFHLWDMAFSVLVPAHCPEFSLNTLDNYVFVNSAVLAAVKEFLNGLPPLSLTSEDHSSLDSACGYFCMAKPTKYDVMWEGRKIAGAAQRKTKKGFLHQGSIALVMPPLEYLEDILLSSYVKDAMLSFTCPLLGKSASRSEIDHAKRRLQELLTTHLSEASLILT